MGAPLPAAPGSPRRPTLPGLVPVVLIGLVLVAGCAGASGTPATDPRDTAAAARAGSVAAPPAVAELARRARGPAVSSVAVRGRLELRGLRGDELLTWSGADLLVARSGALRLEAEDLLVVSDGARLGCRGPGGALDSGPAWRPPRSDEAGPCAGLTPAALVRALLPRDPAPSRRDGRLAVLVTPEGPALLEIDAGATVRVVRRFVFDPEGRRVRVREWLGPDGVATLRAEYGGYRDDRPGWVEVDHPASGVRVRLEVSAWRPEPPMSREDFRLPGS